MKKKLKAVFFVEMLNHLFKEEFGWGKYELSTPYISENQVCFNLCFTETYKDYVICFNQIVADKVDVREIIQTFDKFALFVRNQQKVNISG